MSGTHRGNLETLREAQRLGRHIVIDGVPWLVYLLPPMEFDRRDTPSLVFDSDVTMRRIRDFPENWRDLSDADLFAVSLGV